MGAFSPSKKVTNSLEKKIIEDIIKPTQRGLKENKIIFRGIIFFGLMITKYGPKVIEYNVRFGDPECQVLMRKLDSDLLNILDAVANDLLDKKLKVSLNKEFCICVILASLGYPNKYQTGFEIKNINRTLSKEGIEIFHSGTIKKNGKYFSNGGRVLNFVVRSKDFKEIRDRAINLINQVNWGNGFFRSDIAHKVINE